MPAATAEHHPITTKRDSHSSISNERGQLDLECLPGSMDEHRGVVGGQSERIGDILHRMPEGPQFDRRPLHDRKPAQTPIHRGFQLRGGRFIRRGSDSSVGQSIAKFTVIEAAHWPGPLRVIDARVRDRPVEQFGPIPWQIVHVGPSQQSAKTVVNDVLRGGYVPHQAPGVGDGPGQGVAHPGIQRGGLVQFRHDGKALKEFNTGDGERLPENEMRGRID
jgi:hypothetical protein